MKNVFIYDTEIGRIGIAEKEMKITDMFFANDKECIKDSVLKETPILSEAARQLNEYLLRERKEFKLPICLEGTEFQKSVWMALKEIPYGETRSYKQIAEQIDRPKAYRAVGLANNRNPVAIIIPCHRVIGSNGKLVGYGGGIDLKEKLLRLEKIEI